MARVFGTALDPETGVPIAGRVVYAILEPRDAAAELPAPAETVVDRTLTGLDGTWELVLRETVGYTPYYIIRIWLNETHYADVPAGIGSYEVRSIAIEPSDTEPQPPPTWQPPDYIKTAEKGVPNGVATLDATGLLTPAQRPPGSGGDAILAHSFEQIEPSTVWLVEHPLPFLPAGIEVLDHTGERHYPEISWPTNATVQLNFVSDVRGTVRLS